MTGRILIAIVIAVTLSGCGSRPDKSKLMGHEPQAPKQPPGVPRATREPINPELRAQARSLLEEACEQADPIQRANGIEALSSTIDRDAAPKILQGLTDASWLVRFSAAMSAGKVQLKEAQNQLATMVNDKNRSVQVAVRFALHRLGDTRFSHDLEKTAVDIDKAVRGNTALALGQLNEKSATMILEVMLHDRENAVRLQVAEALWRLRNERGLDMLVAGTISGAADDQLISVLALAGPKDVRVSEHIRGKLVSDYAEVSLAAARAMGQLGSDAGYTIAQNGSKSVDARQRGLAALALGAIGRSDAQASLARLMKDQEANVRLAAATAVLQLKPPAAAAAGATVTNASGR
jgi:hypothetical protein